MPPGVISFWALPVLPLGETGGEIEDGRRIVDQPLSLGRANSEAGGWPGERTSKQEEGLGLELGEMGFSTLWFII